jgi:hypothetical protein
MSCRIRKWVKVPWTCPVCKTHEAGFLGCSNPECKSNQNSKEQQEIEKKLAEDSDLYQSGYEHGKRWERNNGKFTRRVARIEEIIEAHKVDEVMTVNIRTVSDIKDFFNQHLDKVKQAIINDYCRRRHEKARRR